MSGTNARVTRHNQPPVNRGRVEMRIPVTSPNSQARNNALKSGEHMNKHVEVEDEEVQ